ncbi:hypothetical protein [Halalkalicoccus salilacus]|uniref:hypothetical protein n=1 Tax=Halalkalicoccus salilacus TaxID=3117459 RepID=UPI00300EC11D
MSRSKQQYTDSQLRKAIENHEIGGGAPYRNKITKSQADVVVTTPAAFRQAIKRPDTIVYIDSDVDWDLTDEPPFTEFAKGVTVASGRGQEEGNEPNRGHGAILRWKSYQGKNERRGFFRISKLNVRITGLRMKGPQLKRFKPRDDAERNRHLARGIAITGNSCEVDNCELYGWTEAAITLGAKATHHRAVSTTTIFTTVKWMD